MTIHLTGKMQRTGRIGLFVPGPAPVARSLDFSRADNSMYIALF